jgi:hypothetical protein
MSHHSSHAKPGVESNILFDGTLTKLYTQAQSKWMFILTNLVTSWNLLALSQPGTIHTKLLVPDVQLPDFVVEESTGSQGLSWGLAERQ